MRLHQTLTACIALSITLSVSAHEFWIEPSSHQGTPGDTVDLLLKVGERFKGSAQPYLPADFERFERITEAGIEPIDGLLGDVRPAARVRLGDGLTHIIHHTVPFDITFAEGDTRWPDYVELDGLQTQLDAFPDIRKVTPITERYVRSAKSIITTQADVTDRLTGRLPFEWVLDSALSVGTATVTLYEGETPLPGILVKAFRQSDREVTDQAVTDAEGRAQLTLPSADRYLISGVVIRPDNHPDFDWISYWPSLTLEVSE